LSLICLLNSLSHLFATSTKILSLRHNLLVAEGEMLSIRKILTLTFSQPLRLRSLGTVHVDKDSQGYMTKKKEGGGCAPTENGEIFSYNL
jgi:hypothetical protein